MQWESSHTGSQAGAQVKTELSEGPADKSYITSSAVPNIQAHKGHFTLILANIN